MSTAKKPLTFEIDASPRAPVSLPKSESHQLKQVGARVTAEKYRQLKARAALQGAKVQALVEQAITEFLDNHPI